MLPIPEPFIFSNLFGFINIRWYGVLIVAAALAGAWLAGREATRKDENPNHAWDALFVCLVVGLLGARLYHVVSSPANSPVNLQFYLDNPWVTVNLLGLQFQFPRVLAIWEGGLGIYGGILGGALGLIGYIRWQKLSLPRWLDFGAMGLLLGQAIGRWGNYFNQELYGYPTGSPSWGIPIDAEHRLTQFREFSPLTLFHPTFLYESVLCLVGVGIMWWVARRFNDRLVDGDIANLYLIIYPVIRLMTEVQRPDAWAINGIPVAQIISGVLIVFALFMFYVRRRVWKLQPQAALAEAEASEASGPRAPIRRKGRTLKPRQSK